MKKILVSLILLSACNLYAVQEGQGKGDYIPQYLRIGEGTTYAISFQGEGDLYSDDGSMYMGAGYNGRASKYGAGLELREFGASASLLYLDIDATFTASTATIEKIGETFLSDGVIVGDFITLTGASDNSYIGATGEILKVTETTLVISIAAAGSDIPSDLTSVNFVTYDHPIVALLDNGDIHFTIGSSPDAGFHILSDTGANDHAINVEATAGINDHCVMTFDVDAGTYSDVGVMCTSYDADGFDSDDDIGYGHDVLVLQKDATAGDFHALEVAVSDPSNDLLEVEAVATRTGVNVVGQYISSAAVLAAGYVYDVSLSTYVDRTTEFGSDGSDIEMFVQDNDKILFAATSKFDLIQVLLSVNASKSIIPTFEYITDAGAWVAFSAVDETNGFKNNGAIRFNKDDLTTWGQRTINETTGNVGSVDYYWIQISRTRNVLPTSPTESVLSIKTVGDKFYWDKNGNIFSNTVAITDGITAPTTEFGKASIYIDEADGDCKIIFGDGTIKTLATDS